MVNDIHFSALIGCSRLRRELAGVRQEKVLVETVGTDRDKQVQVVTSRLSRVEQEVQEKEAVITRIQETLRHSQEEQTRLSQQLEEKTKLVEKRENTIKKLSGEIIKANEIIAKLQVNTSLLFKFKLKPNIYPQYTQ